MKTDDKDEETRWGEEAVLEHKPCNCHGCDVTYKYDTYVDANAVLLSSDSLSCETPNETWTSAMKE